MKNTLLLLTLIVLLAMTAITACSADTAKPEIWMLHFRPEQLVEPNAQWEFVKHHLDVLQMMINTPQWFSKDQAKSLVDTLKANNIKIAFECGLFDWANNGPGDWTVPNEQIVLDVPRVKFDDTVGEETARIEMGKIQKLVNAGGIPAYLNLDGTIRRMMRPGQDVIRADMKGFDSLDRSIDELIKYMRAWRKRFPEIRFFLLTNFPNWGWKGDTSYWETGMMNGDYFVALKQMIKRTKAAGMPISGITADYGYDIWSASRAHTPWLKYATEVQPTGEKDPSKVDWKRRLLDLERYVHRQGLEFNLIVNSASGVTSKVASGDDSLKFLNEFRKAKGKADRYLIESFYKYPEKVVPETEPYTMTWVVKQAIMTLRNPGEAK